MSIENDPFFKPEFKKYLTEPVFLIGNGKSREKFDLERLRPIGTIIGCNALYRDFTPDILVAIDAKMLKEVYESKYCEENTCIIPKNRTVKVPPAEHYKTEKFNTSGCFAMKIISGSMKPEKCYMLGMDAFPGNMYDHTQNYAANTLQNFKGVCNYYMQVLKTKEWNTHYINVNDKDSWPTEAHDTGNYSFMTFEEFEEKVMT